MNKIVWVEKDLLWADSKDDKDRKIDWGLKRQKVGSKEKKKGLVGKENWSKLVLNVPQVWQNVKDFM